MTFNALHLTVMYILKCIYYNCNTFAQIMLSTLWNVNVKIPEVTAVMLWYSGVCLICVNKASTCLQDSYDSFEIAHVETGQLQIQIAIVSQAVGQVLPTGLTRPVFLAGALKETHQCKLGHYVSFSVCKHQYINTTLFDSMASHYYT